MKFDAVTSDHAESTDAYAISLTDIEFRWRRDDQPVLKIPRLYIAGGERVFIRGRSGSGKTTLLNLLGGVATPEAGKILIFDTEITTLRKAQRDAFRADHVGFIFQMFNLVPYLSVLENVALTGQFSATRRQKALQNGKSLEAEAKRLLINMDLDPASLANRNATELSTGQQQRVAVARALFGAPPLVIADEPTSALDADTREAFLDLLFQEVEATNITLIFVSHDASLANRFDREIYLDDINFARRED